VLLTPVNVLSDAWSADPDFFLLNYHRKNNDYQVRRILGRGVPFAVLDTEGAPYEVSQYTGVVSREKDLREKTSALCIWGEGLAEHVVAEGLYGRSQVHVTGCPRHDFYHETLAEAARSRSRLFLKDPERFVLVTLSAGAANPRFKTAQEELDQVVELGDLGRKYYEDFQIEQGVIQRGLIDLTDKLADRFSGIPFVVRPHPFEDPAPYGDLIRRHSNLVLSQEGAIDGLILRAHCMVQRMGTTPLEAALASVPSLSPSWIPVKSGISEEADSVLDHCMSPESLEEKLSSVLDGSYNRPDMMGEKVKATVSQKFHNWDGLAHVRVADVIETALGAADPGHKKGMTGLKVWGAAAKVARSGALKSWEQSVKYFDRDHVRAVVESIQRLPLDGLPHLRSPLVISTPPSALGAMEMMRPRSVLMTPGE
jgi:surface carbohydrate biosynthesis protein